MLKKDPPRPSINEEAARILRAAASVAEERIRKRFPEKRRNREPSDVGIRDLEQEKGRLNTLTYASRDHSAVFVLWTSFS